MRILLISDVECPYYWDYFERGRLDDVDIILSCGDLKPQYLSFLVTMTHAPVLYVHGNHDAIYATCPPEGCDCIEDKVVTVKGLRILGLGGSILYSGGEHQYTEAQMSRRIRKLRRQLRRSGGVDIVVTHSPALGYGDAEDRAHRGFQCFVDLMEQYHPKYFIHGHVHANYTVNMARVCRCGDTTVINAYERYMLDI